MQYQVNWFSAVIRLPQVFDDLLSFQAYMQLTVYCVHSLYSYIGNSTLQGLHDTYSCTAASQLWSLLPALSSLSVFHLERKRYSSLAPSDTDETVVSLSCLSLSSVWSHPLTLERMIKILVMTSKIQKLSLG